MQIQQKFHLSEDKVKRLIKHAGKGSVKPQEGLLAGDLDPNQVRAHKYTNTSKNGGNLRLSDQKLIFFLKL